jgi:hypothetical protein
LAAVAVILSGCGNGGNGNVGTVGQNAFVSLFASASSGTAPVPISGSPLCNPPSPIGSPTTPTGVVISLNSTLTFRFSQPVDPNSLPNAATGFQGPAEGSIRIIRIVDGLTGTPGAGSPVQGEPADGAFTVEDDESDPTLPPGNNRLVRFVPLAPSNPTAPCQAGFKPTSVYQVTIPQGSTGPVLIVGGQPLQQAVTACFATCNCDSTTGGSSAPCGSFAFTDQVSGPPFVEASFPATSNPAPAAIDPATITDNTIRILISEPLSPASMNPDNVIVRNAATGARVPGTVVFFQTGTFASTSAPPGVTLDLARQSLIEYRAINPLTKGVTYEIAFGSGVRDFGGNVVQTTQANPSAQLLFQTIAGTPCPQSPFTEPFDTTTNQDSTTGAITWGSGVAQATFPLDIVGTGAEGPKTVTANEAFDTNANVIVSGNPVPRQGKFNYTSFTVNAGVTARFHGIWPAHVRVQGPTTINGTVNASAGTVNPATPGTNPTYEFGPRNGTADNGTSIAVPVVPGGVGNAGGGAGGRASHLDVASASLAPGSYCPPGTSGIHTYFGESGQGPSVNGVANTNPSDAFFGGGGGGRSGFIPASFAGESGGYGGAGGTAATIGENGIPRLAATCNPATAVICPVANGGNGLPLGLAQAAVVPVFFVAPVSVQSAGSGGGGGGDKLQTGATAPALDDQGGGGGGGGGGIRFSGVGTFTLSTTGIITANGATGGTGASAQFAGNGGSGSGGQVWIQSFGVVSIASGGQIQVIGQARPGGSTTAGCTNQAAGGGGQGLIQLESGTSTPNTSFASSAGAVVTTAPFPFAGEVFGEVVSTFFDTGSANPDYTTFSEISNIGNAAGAVLTVSYEGVFETVTGGSPDLSTLKSTVGGTVGGAPITAANAATELDGYRFIRFRVRITYPTPPSTPSNAILPSVDSISIGYTVNCP